MKLLITSLILSTLFLTTSFAQGRSGGEGRRPPKEAIEACQSADVGSSCSFAGRNGDDVSGTCTQKESDKPLACKPDKKRE